jgi:hypothetical protein
MTDEDKRKDREFQCDLTKLQVEIEYFIAGLIGLLAILYVVLRYYGHVPWVPYVVTVLVIIALVGLLLVWFGVKNTGFKEIRKKYIETQNRTGRFRLAILGIELILIETNES